MYSISVSLKIVHAKQSSYNRSILTLHLTKSYSLMALKTEEEDAESDG